MKKLLLIAIAFCTFTACDDDDNSELWDEVKNQGNKIEMLESEIESLKLKIEGLNQTYKAVSEMLNGGLITGVEEVTDGDKKGYTFTVQTGTEINTYTIWNGETVAAPQLGVEKEEETGLYYWTLDGEPLLNADGEKIYSAKAQQLRINSSSEWEISYDDGATWKNLGVFTGTVVSNSIEVEVVDGVVVIKQDGKDDIKIPLTPQNTLGITFTNIGTDAGVHVTKNGEYVVEYTLKNASANAIVKAELLNGTNFEVENLPNENKFKVTAKGQLTTDVVLVHVYDGAVCMHTSLAVAPDIKVLSIVDAKPVVSLNSESVTYEGKLILDQVATADITLTVASGNGTLSASNVSLASSVTIAKGQTTGVYRVTVNRSNLTAGKAYTLPITLTLSGEEIANQGSTITLTSSGERVDFQNNSIAIIAGQFVEISLQENMFESIYTGEGTLANLCNGNEEDFWGSNYQSSCPDGDATYGVYIDITFSSKWRALRFEYCTRHNNDNAVPQTIVIGGSNDGTNWTKCFTITEEGLPTAQNTWWYGDPGHDLGALYSNIRFGVTKSKNGDLINEAKKSTALAELKVYGLHE